jgi:hypothetical protein
MPNWQVYQVAFDRPGSQRVTALWNGDGSALRVRVRQNGSSARVVDRMGRSQALQANQGYWLVDLPGATAHHPMDHPNYFFIGGEPLLIVEEGVDASAPVQAPALGDPGSVAREFKVFVNPEGGQTVARGQAAEFFTSIRGYEGYNETVSFSIAQWSTQRFPEPKAGGTLPLAFTAPSGVKPGETATLHFETAGADSGIYYITVDATGGEMSRSFDLALVVN